jgi:hypothetical protein
MQPYSRVLLLISIVFLALIQTGNAQAYAEGQRFVFRAKMGVLAVPPQTSIDISLSYETPFGLTLGEPVDVETILEGDANGVTYRPATLTFMPGLSVDSATGAVTGIPTGDEGAAYAIAVEAVKDGKVVATTEVLERILREPLRVEVVPDDILLTAGDDFPSEGTAATASGGDPDTIGWSLESAPAWLAIKPGITAREVHLARADGVEMTPSSPTVVTLVVYDAEGREDRSRTFNAGILPAILKLLAEDGAANDQFGYSVALSADGGTALLGMPYDDFDGNTNAGAAYVFRRDGDAWVQQAKLVSEPRGYSGSFGSDVALSADGRTALVGVIFRGMRTLFEG